MSAAVKVPVDAADGNAPMAASCDVADGLRKLYERTELCDMAFVANGERFPAHKAMLAAMSTHFRSYLQQQMGSGSGSGESEGATLMAGLLKPVVAPVAPAPAPEQPPVTEPAPAEAPEATAASTEAAPREGSEASPAAPEESGKDADAAAPLASEAAAPQGAEDTKAADAAAEAPPKLATGSRRLELDVTGVQTAESVRIMLDYMYSVGTSSQWEYDPSSLEVNRDVLRLAQHFNLPHLHEYAARWLAKGLATSNVVSRLVICEDLGLSLLRDKIIEQLTAHPTALTMVCTSPEIMQHPKILQDLLIQVASVGASAAKEKEKQKEKELEKEKEKEEKEKEKEKENQAPQAAEKEAAPTKQKVQEKPQQGGPKKKAKKGV